MHLKLFHIHLSWQKKSDFQIGQNIGQKHFVDEDSIKKVDFFLLLLPHSKVHAFYNIREI